MSQRGEAELPDAVDAAMHALFGLPESEQPQAFAQLVAANPEHAELLRQRWQAVTEHDDAPRGRGADPVTTRYRIDGELGRGGMGEVLRAWDRLLQRPVAMKVVRSHDGGPVGGSQLQRFRNEARITAQLDHPGVVPVHDLGTDQDGRAWFVMRLVTGRGADEVLGSAGAAADGRRRASALEIVLKVCDTLAYAHGRGIVHRDLKPPNVMVGSFGEVYVMDWGLAKTTGDGDDQADEQAASATPAATLAGTVLGTPSYMPPERVLSPPAPPDRRGDIYAIGAMLYQVLTGAAPFDVDGSQDGNAILAALRRGPPEPILRKNAAAPAELVAICDKAMARDPAQRYATAAELAEDLRAFLDARAVKAHRQGPWVELRLWVRRNRALASTFASTAAVLVLALVVVLVAWHGADVSNRRFRQLASVVQLEEARRRAAELYPPWPEQVAPLHAWLLEFAEPLQAERELLDGELRQIAARTAPDADDRIIRTNLQRHVAELASFFGTGGTVARVRERLHWAEQIARISIEEHAAAWSAAQAAVAADPRYQGLVLQPQIGLVPLGCDPRSRLLEFAELRSGPAPQRAPSGELQYRDDSGIVFVLVPGGTAVVGAQADDPGLPHYWAGAKADEAPVERLPLRPFLLAKHELTQAQWQRLAGYNPSQAIGADTARHHVGLVTWLEAERVLREQGLELPTEVQWEYGCRAGAATAWYTGESALSLQGHANVADESTRGRFGPGFRFEAGLDDGWATDAPVGSFAANAFGLHDMHGNHWEWCRDVYASRRRPHDPDAPAVRDGAAIHRVYRGGSYAQPADNFARCAYRGMGPADTARHDLGLRAARRLR
jgi:formylglycine-generating enzyme required for sulfatase activity